MPLPTISGTARIITDVELRFAPSGVAVCKFRVAFNSPKKEDDGSWSDGDSYYAQAILFKQAAENAAESLQKLDDVVITGRVKTSEWTTKEGEKRTTNELMVDSIGPALARATAKVQKMQRASAGNAPQGGGSQDPWATAAPAGNTGNFTEEPPF